MWDGQRSIHTFLTIVQAQHFSLFSHAAQMPGETDAKKILTDSPLENWLETTGTPSYYVDEDYPEKKSNNLPEWSNWRGSELLSTFGATHS